MSLMDFSRTIRRLGGAPVVVTRRGQPTVTKGRVGPPQTTTHTITANVQPVSGRELLRLPEGLRTRELISIWTDGELRTANEHSGILADLVDWGGCTFEVELLEEWGQHGSYRRAVAAKMEAS